MPGFGEYVKAAVKGLAKSPIHNAYDNIQAVRKGQTARPGATATGTNPQAANMPSQSFAPGWPGALQGGYGKPQVFPVDAEKHWYTGTEPYTLRTPLYGPEQGAGFSEALQMALEGLRNNQLNFNPIESQARESFQNRTIPSILERLTQSGGQDSSAYMHTLGQAASDLDTNLAAQRAQYGLESNKALQHLLGIGLTPQFETSYSAGREGEGSKAVNSSIQALIKALPFMF